MILTAKLSPFALEIERSMRARLARALLNRGLHQITRAVAIDPSLFGSLKAELTALGAKHVG